jgi:hypothetical protein
VFDSRPGLVGFVGEKVGMGMVFYEYLGLSYQFLFHQMIHIHYKPISKLTFIHSFIYGSTALRWGSADFYVF